MKNLTARFNSRRLKSLGFIIGALVPLTLCSAAPVQAATFRVTNTNDSGSGSLRQALESSNFVSGIDTIAFNIAGSGVKTINVLSNLPIIEEHVVIDGTTQPGFAGAPLIELSGTDGADSGLTVAISPSAPGGNSAIKSLIINRFNGDGIYLFESDNFSITGCRIGTNAAGTSAQPNDGSGIFLFGSSNNVIGGTTAASRNIISGNFADGVLIESDPEQGLLSENNLIQGNYIGTDTTGALPLGNSFDGVHIEDSSGNIVGGVAPGQANRIGHSGFAGVYVPVTAIGVSTTGNAIRGNSIFDSLMIGIDLASYPEYNAGYGFVTANDSGDADGGANNNQNYPVLNTPTLSGGNTIVAGTLNSRPNRTYAIDFYANGSLNLSEQGEGETFITSTTVTTNATGNATFSLSLGANFGGKHITATATQTTTGAGVNDTSEFSEAVLAPGATTTSLQFNTSNYAVNENVAAAIITVTRTGNTTGTASVGYAVSAGTATSPADFTATSGTLQFAAGQTGATFNVSIVNDSATEANETINLTLGTPTGASLGSPSTATLTILDNDVAGFNISGRVSNSGGAGIAGVAISRGTGPGAVTDSNGNYTLTGVPNGTYTLTPIKSGLSFSPSTRSVTVNGANVTSQNFTGGTATRSISGRVANHSGVGIPNVQITRNGASSVFTDANGDYTFLNVAPGTYTIAPVISPSLNGVTLFPPNRSVTVAGSNITNQNFAASFRITGRIANHSGAGIANVQVQRVAGASVVSAFTNSSGDYTFTDVRSGSYTIAPVLTPALSGMSFTPTSKSVTVGTANLTNINFIGMFSVGGRVTTSAGTALANVLVRLATASSSTTVLTDAQGNYKFSNVRSGGYTITATQSGRTFTPASRSVTVGTLSLTNQNFIGSG